VKDRNVLAELMNRCDILSCSCAAVHYVVVGSCALVLLSFFFLCFSVLVCCCHFYCRIKIHT